MAADATKVLVLQYITKGLNGVKNANTVIKKNINILDKQRIAEKASRVGTTRDGPKTDTRQWVTNPVTGRRVLASNAARYGIELPPSPTPSKEPKVTVTPHTMAMARGTQQAGLFGKAIEKVNIRMSALGPGINSVAYASSNMTRQMERSNAISSKTDRAVRKIVAANMSLLGVMFSVMGVLNIVGKLIGMVFSPLTNMDTMFQKLGLAMAFGGDQFKGIMEDMDTSRWVEGWMNLQGVTASVGVMFTDLAAKVFTNEDGSESTVMTAINKGISELAIALGDEKVITSLQNLVIAIAEMAPAVGRLVPKIADLITAVVPFLPFLMHMGVIAMFLMPVISLFTVVIVGLNTAFLAFGYGKIIFGWTGISTAISRAYMMLKLFTVKRTGMRLGSFGIGTIIKTLGRSLIVGIGPAITGAITSIGATLVSILSSITLPIIALVGMILAALRALWVLGDQIKEFGGLGQSISNVQDSWKTGNDGLFNLTNLKGGLIATAGSLVGSERLEEKGRNIILNNDVVVYSKNREDGYKQEITEQQVVRNNIAGGGSPV